MAKQIILLGVSQSGTQVNVSAVFWYPIAQGILPRTSGSMWTGASAVEHAVIQNGTILEESQSFSFPVGVLPGTIKDVLNKAWTERNNALAGIGPGQYKGIFYDSITRWSA